MADEKITAGDARADFANLLNRVAFAKNRTILTRHGRDIAAIVPMEDVELIRRIEDSIDAEKINARKHEPASPVQDVIERLGLGRELKAASTRKVAKPRSRGSATSRK